MVQGQSDGAPMWVSDVWICEETAGTVGEPVLLKAVPVNGTIDRKSPAMKNRAGR